MHLLIPRPFAIVAIPFLIVASTCIAINVAPSVVEASVVNCQMRPHAGVDLSGCNLRSRNFNGVNLAHADLRNTNLNGSELVAANLTGADLNGAHLTFTDLSNARLGGANLSNVTSGSVIGAPSLPAKWKMIGGYLVGPRANLANAQFSGVDLANSDLFDVRMSGANLNRVRSGSITGNPMLPPNWKLVNGYLVGPGADLTNAALNGANLSLIDGQGTDFTDADLVGTSLSGANLSNSILTGSKLANARMNGDTLDGVTSGSIVGTPVLPEGWLLVAGYLVGNSANLTDANFTNANLYGANLVEAKLSGAILTGVSSGAVQGQFSVSLPYGWSIQNGYLFGPGANLVGASLEGTGSIDSDVDGANMSGANLSAVYWDGVNLADVNLSGANLTGASVVASGMTNVNLDGANLTGANFVDSNMSTVLTNSLTICPSGAPGPCSNL
jgi:uncharacterized protein YjbI with pentapeptide repeats